MIMKQQLLPLFAAGAAALYVPFLGVKEKQLVPIAEDSIGKNVLSEVQGSWDDSASSIYSSLIEKHIIEELEDTIHKDHKHHDHDHDHDHGHDHGHHGHHPPGDVNKSIYELIKESKYSERFAKIIDEHDDIKKLLNNTDGNNKHNYTIFVPTDKAFERFPHHPDHPPPEEVVRHMLQHHIIPYRRPIFHDHRRHQWDDHDHDHSQEEEEEEEQDLFHTLTFPHLLPSLHTLPTELHSPLLDHRPQRLRLSINPLFFGHGRVRVNFVNRVVMPDIYASNGLIHAVDGILVPPPPALKGVSLLPSLFSTFSLALEKTGLGEELGYDDNDENDDDDFKQKEEGKKQQGGGEKEGKGGTLFAPTNRAFARLGPRLNAFLFNTERGKKYLKAILKYHFVPGQTVYSDAYYKAGGSDEDDDHHRDGDEEENGYNCPHNCPPMHYDLPTLLSEDARLGVDIKNWRGYTIMVVNGFNRPSVLDGPAEDGVIHVVSSVLIPPRRGTYGDEKEEEVVEEMSVEELVARLEPYTKEEESERPHSGDL